jgi:hypothetical protein
MATTASVTAVDDTVFDRLAAAYVLLDPALVTDFIRDHPEVVAPLLSAIEVVPCYFGPEATLKLDVERDREAHDHTQLFALIQTGLEVDAAQAALDRFDTEWWLDTLIQAAPSLIFSLEFA